MNLSQYIQKTGITVTKLAQDLDCSRGTIYEYMRKKKNPSMKMMRRIHKFTKGEVSANDFLSQAPAE